MSAKVVKEKVKEFIIKLKGEEECKSFFDRNMHNPTLGDMKDKIDNTKNTSVVSLANMVQSMRKNAKNKYSGEGEEYKALEKMLNRMQNEVSELFDSVAVSLEPEEVKAKRVNKKKKANEDNSSSDEEEE